jgi:hypothetical protein
LQWVKPQDMAVRKEAKAMEMIWRGSSSWGAASDIFTQQYPSGNYVSGRICE